MGEKMRIIINPGTGPCRDAQETDAEHNIKHLIADLKIDGVECVRISEKDYDKEYNDGRFAFLLRKGE